MTFTHPKIRVLTASVAISGETRHANTTESTRRSFSTNSISRTIVFNSTVLVTLRLPLRLPLRVALRVALRLTVLAVTLEALTTLAAHHVGVLEEAAVGVRRADLRPTAVDRVRVAVQGRHVQRRQAVAAVPLHVGGAAAHGLPSLHSTGRLGVTPSRGAGGQGCAREAVAAVALLARARVAALAVAAVRSLVARIA